MIITNEKGEKQVVVMLGESVDVINRQMFQLALENNKGNKTHTARALGVSIGTVKNWCRQLKEDLGEQAYTELTDAKEAQNI